MTGNPVDERSEDENDQTGVPGDAPEHSRLSASELLKEIGDSEPWDEDSVPATDASRDSED